MERHDRDASRIEDAFRFAPELLEYIRGLDVAGRELSGPLWCAAGSIRRLRRTVAQLCSRRKGLRPLGLTVHVGEDFRHLLSGLRAVHEPFWWKLMRRGDRLGHALALGWEPRDWCEHRATVLQPRIERAMDLAWLLELASDRGLTGLSRLALLADELDGHVRTWAPRGDGRTLRDICRRLGSLRPDVLRRWLPHLAAVPLADGHADAREQLVKVLLSGRSWREDFVEVRTAEESDVLVAVRDELARLLARWRIPIEVNPSSNLLVGGLPYPLAQPAFHLDRLDRREDRGVQVLLGADDPLTFATTLDGELAYAWAGMVVGAGEAPDYAQEWIERATRTALRARF